MGNVSLSSFFKFSLLKLPWIVVWIRNQLNGVGPKLEENNAGADLDSFELNNIFPPHAYLRPWRVWTPHVCENVWTKFLFAFATCSANIQCFFRVDDDKGRHCEMWLLGGGYKETLMLWDTLGNDWGFRVAFISQILALWIWTRNWCWEKDALSWYNEARSWLRNFLSSCEFEKVKSMNIIKLCESPLLVPWNSHCDVVNQRGESYFRSSWSWFRLVMKSWF